MARTLNDKVAVITGGNSGVGFGIAEEFVAATGKRLDSNRVGVGTSGMSHFGRGRLSARLRVAAVVELGWNPTFS